MATGAVYADLELFRATDNSLVFTKNAAPLDITAWTIRFRIKKRHTDTDAIVGPIDAVITNASSGICTVTVSEAQMTALLLVAGVDPTQPRQYWYDLQREDAGAKNVLVYGRVLVLPQTRVP